MKSFIINDFGKKVQILVATKSVNANSIDEFRLAIKSSKDQFTRFMNDRVSVSKAKFSLIKREFGISSEIWSLELLAFGNHFGLSARQITNLTGHRFSGVVFETISRDNRSNLELQRKLEGFWVGHHYSVSQRKKKICRILIEFMGVHISESQIHYRAKDYAFEYQGTAIHTSGGLYLFQERPCVTSGLEMIATNIPDRDEAPYLIGISLSHSGGVDGLQSLPSATKIILHRIGSSNKDVASFLNRKTPIPGGEDKLWEHLAKKIPKLLEPENVDKKTLKVIDNSVSKGQSPFILQSQLR